MSPDTLRAKLAEYHRSARNRTDVLTEALAVELAPFFDAVAEAQDADPRTPTPMWGFFA